MDGAWAKCSVGRKGTEAVPRDPPVVRARTSGAQLRPGAAPGTPSEDKSLRGFLRGNSCWEGLFLVLAQTPQDRVSEAR